LNITNVIQRHPRLSETTVRLLGHQSPDHIYQFPAASATFHIGTFLRQLHLGFRYRSIVMTIIRPIVAIRSVRFRLLHRPIH
jgi:hypothetical protein